MAIIAKNNTVLKIEIADLGISIPALSQRDLTEVFIKDVIAASNDLYTVVANGLIIINDGIQDLSISDGIKHITIQTEWEDQDLISNKIKVSYTDATASYLIDKLESLSNDIIITKINSGENEILKLNISPNFIPNGIIGNYVVDDTESTTTLITWQTKLSIILPVYTGMYRVGYTMEFNANANNKVVEVRFYNVTDNITIALGSQSTNAATNYFSFSGFHHQIMSGSTKTFSLQYRQISGACSVKNAELEYWRA